MKGSASGYGVSGAGEVTRMDYQERRKDSLINFGLFIGVIVAIIAVIYVLFQKSTDAFKLPNPFEVVSGAVGGAVETAKAQTVNAAVYPIPATQAINERGQYYPVTTQEGLEQRLNDTGVLQPLVLIGNAVTGGAATAAGAQGAATVNRLGLNNEYDKLDPLSKTFVSVGEGFGMLFGLDVIQMGSDMKKEIDKSAGVV